MSDNADAKTGGGHREPYQPAQSVQFSRLSLLS
jgi:hypothetical protein